MQILLVFLLGTWSARRRKHPVEYILKKDIYTYEDTEIPMTSPKQGAGDSGGNSDNTNLLAPPDHRSLLPQKAKEPFSTAAAFSEVKSIVKLTVEFPLKMSTNRQNDLALMFKRFTKKLLTVDRTAAVLN